MDRQELQPPFLPLRPGPMRLQPFPAKSNFVVGEISIQLFETWGVPTRNDFDQIADVHSLFHPRCFFRRCRGSRVPGLVHGA